MTLYSGIRTFINQEIRHVLSLQDAPWRWKVGFQAAVALGIPAALLTLAGYQGEALVASLGAFTALYFAGLRTLNRARLLPLVAASFTLASLLGTLIGADKVLLILSLVSFTSLVSILSLGIGLGSPGPMMFVLVGGVSNYLANKGSFAGSTLGDLTIPVLVGIGAVAAYLIVISPLILPSARRHSEPAPSLRDILRFEHWDLTSRIIAYRVIVSVTIASLIAVPAGFAHACWVVMVAGVVLQVSHSLRRTVTRVAHRMLGTIAGILLFTLIVSFGTTGMQLIVLIALLQGIVEIVVARNYGLALVFITPLSLSIATANATVPAIDIATERIIDTVLGVGIALLVLILSEWLMRRGAHPRPA